MGAKVPISVNHFSVSPALHEGQQKLVKRFYVRIAKAFVLALCSIVNRVEPDAQTYVLLGSIFSSVLFVMTQAFHISYPDKTALVSLFFVLCSY